MEIFQFGSQRRLLEKNKVRELTVKWKITLLGGALMSFHLLPGVILRTTQIFTDLYRLACDCFIHSHLQSSSYMSTTCMFPIESPSESLRLEIPCYHSNQEVNVYGGLLNSIT